MIKKMYRCFVYLFILLFFASCQNQVEMQDIPYPPVLTNKQKEGITYNITYKNVDGLNNPNPTIYGFTKDVTLKPVLKDGYGFIDWYTSPTFEPSTVITGWKAYEMSTDLVLYAKYDQEVFNIIYHNVDGFNNPNPKTFSKKKDFTLSTSVSKNQWEFQGWFTTPTFEPDTKITGWKAGEMKTNVDLYAKTLRIEYNIEYRSSISGYNNPNPRTYNIRNSVTLQPAQKNGYLFQGWYTNSSYTDQSKIESWAANEKQQDLVLWAKFLEASIKFDKRVIIFKGASDEPVTLNVTVSGYDNTNPTWTSLDPSIATIQNGLITPVSNGSTTIRYEAGGGIGYAFVIVMPDYANTTYDSGSVTTANGYLTDTANVVSYRFTNSLDFQGRLAKSAEWAKTTFSSNGWTWNLNGDDISFINGSNTYSTENLDLTVIPVIAYDSGTNTSFVVIYQLLTNTGTEKLTGQKFGAHADIQLANNDSANIMPKPYGARMYDKNTKLAFDMYCCDGEDCTPVNTLWYGGYSSRVDHLWDGTIRKQELTNTDSGMCYSWMNLDIDPGKTVVKSIRMTLVEYDPNNP